MTKTYRKIGGVMGPVDVRDDIPGWAQGYAVGDEIGFRHPETAELITAPLAGFSCSDEYRGLPVIVPPPELADVLDPSTGVAVIREIDHVAPEVVRAAHRRSGDTPG